MTKPASDILTPEVLIKHYIEQGKTEVEICAITGAKSPTTVRKYMKIYGIKPRDYNEETSLWKRNSLSKEQLAKILVQLYVIENLSLSKIAKRFNTDYRIIKKYLDEIGVATRNHKEANAFYNTSQNNHRWKGGYRNSEGYIQVKVSEHPNRDACGYVYEHRLLVEKLLGRVLSPNEFVHHKNGDRKDNRPENLEIMSNSAHASYHGRLRKIRPRKSSRQNQEQQQVNA